MPFSIMRAGFPATRQFGGTSFITTLAAATTQLSPILIPGMIMLYNAVRADITFFTNPSIHVKPARGVVGQNAGAEVYCRALADMNARRIAFVQFGRERDPAVRRDIHSPQLIEIK